MQKLNYQHLFYFWQVAKVGSITKACDKLGLAQPTISNQITLLEKSLGIPNDSLHIIALKDYYWPIGTHYYKPLNKELYRSRDKFIDKAQHPEKGILVVGEAISNNQGWTEGALESVKAVLTKKWIKTIC